MRLIEVNHQELRAIADAIDTYCDTQENEMQRADMAVKDMLTSDWIGPDAMEFGGKWEGVDSADSSAIKFSRVMRDYAETLRACAQVYKTAQEDVYNAASLLPRW